MYKNKNKATKQKNNSEPVRYEKVKKEQKDKPLDKGINLKVLAIPLLIAAIVTVIIYIVVSQVSSSNDMKTDVLVASENISENTYIKPDEVDKYFQVVKVDSSVVCDNNVTDESYFKNGALVSSAMLKNQVLLKDNCIKDDKKDIRVGRNTDVTSLSVKDFGYAVGGTLREGNVVDIYAINPETDQLDLLVDGILIKDAFNSSGEKVTDEGIAVTFNVYAPDDKKEAINRALAYGDIQLYKTKL